LVLDGVQRLGYRNGPSSLVPVPAGQPVPVTVDLWSTSIILQAGHRLRVSITSSNAPRFWPNPNDGTTYGGSASPKVANVSILHDEERASFLEVPNPDRPDTDVTVCDPSDAGVEADAFVDAGGYPDADADADTEVDAQPVDGGTHDDAATGKDGGRTSSSEADGGCGCRAARTRSFGYGWLFMIGWVVVAWRRGKLTSKART
ncbi:MAG: CocE/NonD family hydrolase C-terminal non-catalytic domain-containing protein, partial [Coriobacteriia bacterium]|nr:CocE/NonD family hydrolase C-terminal non-catalytic domain-containing protein [Coriobacteriia bacterium]